MAASLRNRKRKRIPNLSPDFVYQPIGSMKGNKLERSADNQPECSSQESPSSGFSELPSEMILQVLRYLPIKDLAAASGVCKQWRKLCKDPSLWKCASFEGTEVDRLQWNFWKRLSNLGTTCLDLHACVNPGTSAPRKAISYIIKLTNVNALYFGVIEKADLSAIIDKMRHLKILHVICLLPPLTRSSSDMTAWDETILYDVGRLSLLTDLEDLKLSSVYGLCEPCVTFQGGLLALGKLKKLKKLVLSNFQRIGRDVLFPGIERHLEHVELGNCSEFSVDTYRDLSRLENLKSFSLTGADCVCYTIPCSCIRRCLRSLKKLQKLTLMMCCLPWHLNSAIQELPELRTLEMWPYLDQIIFPMGGGEEDKEKFISGYMSIFHGLDHLPYITIGIMDKSVKGLYDPFDYMLYKHLEISFHPMRNFTGFCHYGDNIEEEGLAEEIWDRYNRFLFDDEEEESSESGMSSDVRDGEEHRNASCSKHHGNVEELDRTTPSRRKKSQGKGKKRGRKKTPKMGTYDRIKYGLIDLLPTTRLTMYRVKNSRSRGDADTEMFYISRKEEHYNMPTLSQT